MFKEIYNLDTIALLAKAGLVIFFLVFLGVSIWAMSRPKKDVKAWADLPLSDSK